MAMEVAAVRSHRLDDVGEIRAGAAAPIFDALQLALDLSPVPGLGLVPTVLFELVERVQVRDFSSDFHLAHYPAHCLAHAECSRAFRLTRGPPAYDNPTG